MKYLIALIIWLSLPLLAYAQDAVPNTTVVPETADESPTFEFFNVNVKAASQSAWNKKVTVLVEFVATIDSEKVQIDWDVPSGIILEPKYPSFFSVKAGQTYKFKALITPKTSGTYNIAANVISWQYNTNYTSSGDALLTFDEKLLTSPIMPDYSLRVIFKWVLIIGIVCIAGYVGVLYAIKSKRRFDKWFNLPD